MLGPIVAVYTKRPTALPGPATAPPQLVGVALVMGAPIFSPATSAARVPSSTSCRLRQRRSCSAEGKFREIVVSVPLFTSLYARYRKRLRITRGSPYYVSGT